MADDPQTASDESRDRTANETTRSLSGVGRRGFLQTVAATGTVLGASGQVIAKGKQGSNGRQKSNGSNGFPPAGITEWGPSVSLGNGAAQTFTTATPSGKPKYHGLYLERDALEGLPSADDLATSGDSQYTDKYGSEGEALQIHHQWSQEFFIPFPSTESTPFTFLSLNWNPTGHPPVWFDPHFDIHFNMLPMETVDAITGPAAPTYDLPDRYIPAGFARSPVVDERVITDMGEHMVDPTVPEMNGGEFTNTLIWGAADPDDDGIAELSFVEPMITQSFLQAHSGVDRRSIAQPDSYARPGNYPTEYTVRDVPNDDAIVVAIENFVAADGDT